MISTRTHNILAMQLIMVFICILIYHRTMYIHNGVHSYLTWYIYIYLNSILEINISSYIIILHLQCIHIIRNIITFFLIIYLSLSLRICVCMCVYMCVISILLLQPCMINYIIHYAMPPQYLFSLCNSVFNYFIKTVSKIFSLTSITKCKQVQLARIYIYISSINNVFYVY